MADINELDSKMGIEQIKAIVDTFNKAKVGTYLSLTICNTINFTAREQTFSINRGFSITLNESELIIGGGKTIGIHFYKLDNITGIWLEVNKITK